MANMEKEQSVDDLQLQGDNMDDRIDQSHVGDCSSDSATDADNTSSAQDFTVTRCSGLKKRSSGIIVEDGDEEMMLQRNGREDNVLQWLQALDVQVMGACRSGERLKPLLKLNACTGAAEDRLLMHLSQNFEPSEVGMLARCLCAPLVSLRVGKIDKQGTLLCPTSTRGNLNLTLLPSSGLLISYVGDDGFTDRIATFHTDAQCSSVEIEELEADRSGRSFALRIPDHDILFFWCSEKCVLSGIELLRKMRDLLKCKPSLSEVTGISKSRLDAYSVHLGAYLVGSTMADNALSSSSPLSTPIETIKFGPNVNVVQSSVLPLNASSYSLSPRSSSLKDISTRNSSLKRDMFRRCGECYMSCVDSSISINTPSISKDNFPEPSGPFLFPLEKPGIDTPVSSPAVQIPSEALPLISPYYCWCPPTTATITMPHPELLCNSESIVSSLLSNNLPSGISTLNSHHNFLNIPTSKLPPFLPDGFPLPLQSSKQIPTFTPLMCDPIVHIPVIDFCSTGQGYLVSTGTSLSLVHSNIVGHHHHPLIAETGSAVEKGARETLRLLISRSNELLNPPLMELLAPVLTIRDDKENNLAVGRKGGLYATRITASSLSSETRGEGRRENTVSGGYVGHDPSDGGTCGGGSVSGRDLC